MEKVDLFALIDELQQEIEESPNRLLSKDSKVIDTNYVLEIIEDIRNASKNEFESSRRKEIRSSQMQMPRQMLS